MIRVTLTNSKLDKELGRKKKTSTEDFLFSRKKLTAFSPQNTSLLHFVNAHKNHSGFIPPVILFLSRTQFSSFTLPFGLCSDSNPVLHADVARVKPPVR